MNERRTCDLGEQRMHILILKRQPSTKHNIQNNPTAPNIDLRTRIQSTSNNLRRSIIRTSTARLQEVAVLNLITQPEVRDLDVQVVVQQHVLWLKVAMDDLALVRVVDAGDYLLEEAPCLGLVHAPVGDDVVEELPSGVFEHDDDVRRRTDDFIPLDVKIRLG